MKFFLVGAIPDELEAYGALGLCDGARLDPDAARGGIKGVGDRVKAVLAATDGPVFVPVVSAPDVDAMLIRVRALAALGERVVAVLPPSEGGLEVCATCYEEGLPTEVGPCLGAAQVLVAAKAGATYVLVAVGQLEDVGHEGIKAVDDAVGLLSHYDLEAEVVAGGLQTPQHLVDVALAASHAAAVPVAVLERLLAAGDT